MSYRGQNSNFAIGCCEIDLSYLWIFLRFNFVSVTLFEDKQNISLTWLVTLVGDLCKTFKKNIVLVLFRHYNHVTV